MAEAERILTRWKERGIRVRGGCMCHAQLDELKLAEGALSSLDEPTMLRWGGLNGTIKRVAGLQRRRDTAGGAQPAQARLDSIQGCLLGSGGGLRGEAW